MRVDAYEVEELVEAAPDPHGVEKISVRTAAREALTKWAWASPEIVEGC